MGSKNGKIYSVKIRKMKMKLVFLFFNEEPCMNYVLCVLHKEKLQVTLRNRKCHTWIYIYKKKFKK